MPFCYCDTHGDNSLDTYYVYYLDETNAKTVASDFIRKYRAYPTSRQAISHLQRIGIKRQRIVKCFTIVDAFRLISWEQDPPELKLRPFHRILEQKGDTWVEILDCPMMPKQSNRDAIAELRAQRLAQLKSKDI